MKMKDIVEIRHLLHDHPDVSGCECFAHDLVVSELISLNPDQLYTHVGGNGVVAFWQSPSGSDRTLAFRADTDALPIGHRCGHDGHTSIMLEFARHIAAVHRPYNVLLVFQPEEETGMGARKIVESGLLQKHHAIAIFGLHNLPGYPLGTVVLNRGTFAAASSGVIFSLKGRETHASTPEKGINPGLAVAEIIQRFAALNTSSNSMCDSPQSGSHLTDSFRQSTLICCRVGEEAFGTSAGNAQLMFTLRAFSNKAMESLMNEACSIVDDIARREGLAVGRSVREPFAATENTPELVDKLQAIMQHRTPLVTTNVPFRWSEDFAEYLKVLPGAFFGIGSGEHQPELHHPHYDFPDALIAPAASCFDLILNNIVL